MILFRINTNLISLMLNKKIIFNMFICVNKLYFNKIIYNKVLLKTERIKNEFFRELKLYGYI